MNHDKQALFLAYRETGSLIQVAAKFGMKMRELVQVLCPDSVKNHINTPRITQNTKGGPRQRGVSQGWREIGGKRKYFRSKWEANYGRYLELLKKSGQITDWHHEPDTFWFDGIKRGVCSYLPDYKITMPDGTFYYVEVKGFMDAKSKTKLKRMQKYYPTVLVVLIDGSWFSKNRNKLASVIPDWE